MLNASLLPRSSPQSIIGSAGEFDFSNPVRFYLAFFSCSAGEEEEERREKAKLLLALKLIARKEGRKHLNNSPEDSEKRIA